MIKNYIKIAWRNILGQKTHSIINIGGLAVSMAIVLLITLWIDYEAKYDTYHPDATQIHLLSHHESGGDRFMEHTPYIAYETIPTEVPEVELAAIGQGGEVLISMDNHSFYEKSVLYIDSNWTQMFRYQELKGSFIFFKQHSSRQIAISQSKARQYFGNDDPIGQTLLVDSIPVSVGAVFADVPSNSSFPQDILIPYIIPMTKDEEYKEHILTDWGMFSYFLFLKINPHASIPVVSDKITQIIHRNAPFQKKANIQTRLTALSDLYWSAGFENSVFPKGNKNTMRVLGILAVVLLLTACVNFVNLSIARSTTRNKEIGIRKVNGANRRQLFTQIMVEILLNVILATLLSVILAFLLLPYFNLLFESELTLSIFHGRTLLIVAGLLVSVTLLTGIYPALLLSYVSPLQLFKDKIRLSFSVQSLRKVLLVGQLVVAVCATVGAIVIHLQFRYIQQQTAAYKKEQVFSFHAIFPQATIRFGSPEQKKFSRMLKNIKTELLQQHTIQHVSNINGLSLIDNTSLRNIRYRWQGLPAPEKPYQAITYQIDTDYMGVSDLELVAGRWFDEQNTADKHNLVINETAAKVFGLQEPVVGSTYIEQIDPQYVPDQGTVIGIVKDFHHGSLHSPIQPVIFKLESFYGTKFIVRTQEGQVSQALDAAHTVWKKHFAGYPFEYTFLDEEFNQLYKDDIRAGTFSLIFTVLTVIIACLGILGIAIFSAQQRTKEIGIRKVLGASISKIVMLLSKDFAKMTLLAILLASPLVWWVMTIWLDNFAYRIALHWWMLATGGLIIVGITLATVGIQSIRAARVNPVDSLRDE